MFETRITELFGIKRPIVQGGLMWIATAELTSAVANSGGMGFMTALSHDDPEDFRREIRRCRELTGNPFGANLTFLPTLREIDYPAYLKVCLEERIEFIETAGRSPEPYMDTLNAAGVKVVHKCTSVRHALKAQKLGCAAVSIDGFECAGHPGEDDVTSLVLLPAAVDALNIPVIGSGGFGDGRGLVAALALGADGVNMGTRFVATREAPVHDALKQALVDADETDTRLIMRTLGNTERVLHTETVDKVLEIEARGGARIEDIARYVSGLTARERVLVNGEVGAGAIAVGQVAGLIRDVPTVAELMDGMMEEAERIVGRLGGKGGCSTAG